MTHSIVCSNPNVFALNAETIKLATKFCSCPAAKSLVDTVAAIAPTHLQIGPFPNPKLIPHGDPDTYVLNKVHIEIPQESSTKKIYQLLSHITVELFNAKNYGKTTKNILKARSGEIGVDEFARNIEKIEYQGVLGRDNLFQSCAKPWNMEEILQISSLQAQPETFHLWNADVHCHTDSIRKRWIDQFQKNRCAKHPEDLRSCQIKKSDFCDYSVVKSMSPEKQKKFLDARYCEAFSRFTPEEQKLLAPAAKEMGCRKSRTDL